MIVGYRQETIQDYPYVKVTPIHHWEFYKQPPLSEIIHYILFRRYKDATQIIGLPEELRNA